LHSPPQRGDYPPFLPLNFYEAPQYASYRPLPAVVNVPSRRLKTSPTTPSARARGRPVILLPNSIKAHLASFSAPVHALSKLPGLDAIVTGAVNLDYYGNTRPLSKKLVLVLLRRIDVISTAEIQTYMHCSLRQCTSRHAQRLAQCLRVIERAAAKLARTQWPEPDQIEEDGGCAASRIPLCGNATCTVCRSSVAVASAWSLPAESDDSGEGRDTMCAVEDTAFDTDTDTDAFSTNDWLTFGDDSD
jgi:hypothetical protein